MEPMTDTYSTADTYAAPPALLPEPVVLNVGPTLPAWYRKPPKPKLENVLAEAQLEKGDHELRIEQVREMLSWINLNRVGHFERDREKIEAGEIEVFQSTSLRDEHDAACAWIASMDLAFTALARESFDREESAAKEDFLHFVWERWNEVHSEAGNAPLNWALPDTLQKYGMLVAYVGIDPMDEETGLSLRMVDPATVFPVHEGERGLAQVFRIYNAAASRVLGDFGDASGKVERKLTRLAKNDDGQYDPRHEGEVIEFWDRHWGMVIYEGELLRTWEHGYGCVPFVIAYGCFGQQGFTRSPDMTVSVDRRDIVRSMSMTSERSTDLARTAQPFLWRRVRSHAMEESIGGRLLTMLRRSINPPLVVKQGLLSANEGDPEIDNDEGGQTKIRDDDAIEPLPNLPSPEIMSPLLNLIGQNRQTGMAPGLLMGQNPAAQTSGSALDILAQGGFEKWSPLVLVIERFCAAVGKRSLELVRDWGELLGPEGDRGVLMAPRRFPDQSGASPWHKVTPELIRRTGTRISCSFSKFNPQSLGPVGNGLVIAKSMGAIDKRSIIRILGYTSDVEGTIRRINEDQLDDVPEVLQANTLELLAGQANRALQSGDEESARNLLMKAKWVAEQMQLSMMQKMQGMSELQGGMPGVPAGQSAQPPMGPPPGASLPQYGIPTGTNGGRPAEPMPPPGVGD